MRCSNQIRMASFAMCCILLNTACFGNPTDYHYLYQAVLNGDAGTVSTYLEDGGDVDILIAQYTKDDQMGCVGPMIPLALQAGQDGICALLLRAGADTGIVKEIFGLSAIQIAAQKDMVRSIALMIEKHPEDLFIGKKDETPLVMASAAGNYDTVEIVLAGVDRNRNHKGTGSEDALFAALVAGNSDIARLLIQSGAKPETDGILHAAVSAANHSMVRFLLRRGLSPFTRFEGYSIMDLLVARLAVRPYDQSAEIILNDLIMAGVNACEFSQKVESLPSATYDRLKRAAPNCDW